MKMWILGVTALTSLGIAACSSSSSSPPAGNSASDSGSSSGGGSSSSGGGSVGGGSSSGGATDASGEASACSEGSIYTRLGGHAGIRGAVNAIVAAELADPDIVTYFFFQTTPPTPGHPTADQIEQCFTDLVAFAVGGPGESYPPDGGVTDDAGTFQCNPSMQSIHAPLLISGGTFDKFITIAGGVLTTAGVCPADIATLAGALEDTKTEVVTPSLIDAGYQAFPGDAAAAIAAATKGASDGAVEQ
jgi:hypothetical protein